MGDITRGWASSDARASCAVPAPASGKGLGVGFCVARRWLYAPVAEAPEVLQGKIGRCAGSAQVGQCSARNTDIADFTFALQQCLLAHLVFYKDLWYEATPTTPTRSFGYTRTRQLDRAEPEAVDLQIFDNYASSALGSSVQQTGRAASFS